MNVVLILGGFGLMLMGIWFSYRSPPHSGIDAKFGLAAGTAMFFLGLFGPSHIFESPSAFNPATDTCTHWVGVTKASVRCWELECPPYSKELETGNFSCETNCNIKNDRCVSWRTKTECEKGNQKFILENISKIDASRIQDNCVDLSPSDMALTQIRADKLDSSGMKICFKAQDYSIEINGRMLVNPNMDRMFYVEEVCRLKTPEEITKTCGLSLCPGSTFEENTCNGNDCTYNCFSCPKGATLKSQCEITSSGVCMPK